MHLFMKSLYYLNKILISDKAETYDLLILKNTFDEALSLEICNDYLKFEYS